MKMITTKTEELKHEWENYVQKNDDPYGSAVVDVVVKVCENLDKGMSCEEAERLGIKDSDITGFQAGCMAAAIAHFHPRGEEFKLYWNKQFGKGDEKGVINPAIFTIKSR